MKNSIKVEVSKDTAKIVYDILLDHQEGYSNEFVPERVMKIREFMNELNKNLYK